MYSPEAEPSAHAPSAPDRRLYPRHTVQVQIEIRQEGSDVPVRFVTTDLSRGGCYVELLLQFPVGTRIRATLWLDQQPIVVRGLVVTCHPQFGNGIKFVEFEGQAEQLLGRYLDAIPN